MTSLAFAAAATAPQGPSTIQSFIPMILIFVVFYFLLIRPQQKKAKQQQEFLTNLKKGMDVVTSGGIHGRITGITETIVTLEIAEKVRIKINRSAVSLSAADAEKIACAPTKGGG